MTSFAHTISSVAPGGNGGGEGGGADGGGGGGGGDGGGGGSEGGSLGGGDGGVEGGDEGGGDDSMEALLTEIQGLRADLNAGKVAVYLDGAKVTSGIRNVVNGAKVNSYGL